MKNKRISLSIIVPCYNEEDTIISSLQNLSKIKSKDMEIIVINDASTDNTLVLLQSNPDLYDVLISHEENQGKGKAISTGLSLASKDYIVVQDADLEYNPLDLVEMKKIIEGGEADVVYGSRYLYNKARKVLPFWHSKVNYVLTFFSNMFTNLSLTDMETCYKMIPRSAFDYISIREKGFGVEPEITAKLAKTNLVFYEYPVEYNPRSRKMGKKIKWTDGVRAMYCIIRYTFID